MLRYILFHILSIIFCWQVAVANPLVLLSGYVATESTPFVSQLLSSSGSPTGYTIAQSFTMVGTTISKAKVWFNTASGQSISIRISSNKYGSEIATVTGLTATTDANGVAANFTITGLTDGTVYWVHILEPTGTVSLRRQDSSSAYAGGSYFSGVDETIWNTSTEITSVDLKFEVYP